MCWSDDNSSASNILSLPHAPPQLHMNCSTLVFALNEVWDKIIRHIYYVARPYKFRLIVFIFPSIKKGRESAGEKV